MNPRDEVDKMSVKINQEEACKVVREANAKAMEGKVDHDWLERMKRMSELCGARRAKTHIAFLGTAIIAKATQPDVDMCAIKPKHQTNQSNDKAFSARPLCENVLVPLSTELAFDIGVSGRQPLNNQPYFRMGRVGDDTPVREDALPAFNYMVSLIEILNHASGGCEARRALAAFIAERRQQQVHYAQDVETPAITQEALSEAIGKFVADDSENGRRAQAVVAGLMDAFADPERVATGRINDPDRTRPGDVCVLATDLETWEKVFEVRDKPVLLSDIQIFGKKCADRVVGEAAVVAVSDGQSTIAKEELEALADDLGLTVTMFTNWEDLVAQAFFWASEPASANASRAVGYIRNRLIEIEASQATVELWERLTNGEEADR